MRPVVRASACKLCWGGRLAASHASRSTSGLSYNMASQMRCHLGGCRPRKQSEAAHHAVTRQPRAQPVITSRSRPRLCNRFIRSVSTEADASSGGASMPQVTVAPQMPLSAHQPTGLLPGDCRSNVQFTWPALLLARMTGCTAVRKLSSLPTLQPLVPGVHGIGPASLQQLNPVYW
jgi:hypothetical protein